MPQVHLDRAVRNPDCTVRTLPAAAHLPSNHACLPLPPLPSATGPGMSARLT